MPTIAVVKHVDHEGPGLFGRVLEKLGARLVMIDASCPNVRWSDPADVDGLLIMGGPMNVDELEKYPFLAAERAWIYRCIENSVPMIGVCLGAQLIARVLGAEVYPAFQKEIGWFPVMREPAADGDSLCSTFGQTETVFQWHGDTFDIPEGAEQLFSSPLCENQAFRYRGFAYGFQFHIEVTAGMIDEWLREPTMSKEIQNLEGQVDEAVIRSQTQNHIQQLATLSQQVAAAFYENIVGVRS